jgi:hypothetical protein
MLKCKVFSATKSKDRDELGERVTAFLQGPVVKELVGREVHQSSDSEFHCLTIVIWYR